MIRVGGQIKSTLGGYHDSFGDQIYVRMNSIIGLREHFYDKEFSLSKCNDG